MTVWRQLSRGLRALTDRTSADRDIADEVEHYLERATAAHLARGLAPDAARRAAQLELGNVTVAREQVRGYGWENAVESLATDLEYAGRRLRSSPGFTALAALTLALGIGATTAIFSAVNPVLFEPLPYPQADRLVMIADRAADGSPLDVTYGTYGELLARSRSLEALGVADRWQPVLTGTAEPERVDGQRVSVGYFRALGVGPAWGRDFEDADALPGGPRLAIMSDGLARRRFGGARAVVGQQITLGDDQYSVVGVMPRGFENVLAPAAEIWTPLQYRSAASFQSAEWGHHLRMVGRLNSGVSLDQARREIAAIARAPIPEFSRPPWASLRQGLSVNALQHDLVRGVKPALVAIVGAVLLVLAIACVNVTNLLLARGAQRRGEFALRAALGADRRRLVRQLLTESLLLAALGGALGLGVAQLGVGALVALSPPGLPRAGAIRLDGPVFAFALGVTALIGLAVGVVPALGASRSDLKTGLQQGTRRAAGTHRLSRSALVVAEVALALLLLVGAGLLLRSLERLFAVAPGFDASNLLTMQVDAAGRAYASDTATYQFFTQALDAVRRVPGVTAAAFSSQLPLSGDLEAYGVQFDRGAGGDPNEDGPAFRYAVTPDYFATMRIPLRRGRLLDAGDRPGGPAAVLINESLARRRFPGQDPIGKRVRIGPQIDRADLPPSMVVGVVGDVKQVSLAAGQADAVYLAMGQWIWVDNLQTLVVRTRVDAALLAPAVKRAIWSVDAGRAIVRVATMDGLLDRLAAQRRFALIVFETFALAALALAAIGIYGVLAGSVADRTREIGIRAALGASRGSIVSLVLRQGLTLTGLGVGLGLCGAVAASRALVSLLFGVSRLDPLTYLGVVALLWLVSAAACGVPAWRAARIDPSITLQAQ